MSYSADRKWSDTFIPAMKQVIGPRLLVTSSFDVDTKQATDLVVLGAQNKQIACRVRSAGYFEKYGKECTFRYGRSSGAKTEWEKILNGFGDWMFYAHAAEDNKNFRFWWILDLNVLRQVFRDHKHETLKRGVKYNTDETTSFVWFDITSFPPNFVIDSGSYYQK